MLKAASMCVVACAIASGQMLSGQSVRPGTSPPQRPPRTIDGTEIPFLFTTRLPAPPDLPQASDGWVLQISSYDGFSGDRLVDVAVTSRGRLRCTTKLSGTRCGKRPDATALRSISEAVRAAMPAQWFGLGFKYEDSMKTLLLLRRRESGTPRTYVEYWDGDTRYRLPDDVAHLYEHALAFIVERGR